MRSGSGASPEQPIGTGSGFETRDRGVYYMRLLCRSRSRVRSCQHGARSHAERVARADAAHWRLRPGNEEARRCRIQETRSSHFQPQDLQAPAPCLARASKTKATAALRRTRTYHVVQRQTAPTGSPAPVVTALMVYTVRMAVSSQRQTGRLRRHPARG